jgi:L-amino acid N-acyltransferase YncA
MQLQTIGCVVRDLEVADMKSVMLVEGAAFQSGKKTGPELINLIRANEAVVLQRGAAILGYAVFELRKQSIFMHRIAVSYPLCGFGSTLMADIKRRILSSGRSRIEAVVDEYDVTSQKFFQRCGLRAVRIMPEDRSKYLFRFTREQA